MSQLHAVGGPLFQAPEAQQHALLKALNQPDNFMDERHEPAGYNIGISDNPPGGQTVPNLHVYLLPPTRGRGGGGGRGDCEDMRGGVR